MIFDEHDQLAYEILALEAVYSVACTSQGRGLSEGKKGIKATTTRNVRGYIGCSICTPSTRNDACKGKNRRQ